MDWIRFPDERLAVHGLAWPEGMRLRRFPERFREQLPPRVWELAQCPGGGRIRLRTDSGSLAVRFAATRPMARRVLSGIDLYVDGTYWSSVVSEVAEIEEAFFTGAGRQMRDITLYLPLHQTVELHAIGLEPGTTLLPPEPFPRTRPWILYGSSIAQGVGAARPAMTYQAILSRRLGLDFMNFGFGGAGKAEAAVVERICEVDTCAFVFDLGKSYGTQDHEPYAAMLARARRAHPQAPLVCMTPIFSTRELFDAGYRELSTHTRAVVGQAVAQRRQAGEDNVHLLEGEELLGPDDADELIEGVHPTDLGFWRIAERLEPILRPLLLP